MIERSTSEMTALLDARKKFLLQECQIPTDVTISSAFNRKLTAWFNKCDEPGIFETDEVKDKWKPYETLHGGRVFGMNIKVDPEIDDEVVVTG